MSQEVLKFASVQEAVQHLSDITESRVVVAEMHPHDVEEDLKVMITDAVEHLCELSYGPEDGAKVCTAVKPEVAKAAKNISGAMARAL